MMKKVSAVVTIAVFGFILLLQKDGGLLHRITGNSPSSSATDPIFASAFEEQRGNFVAEGSGTVIRILSDDNNGSRHQRFIVELASGQTLLISHSIDIAPRVQSLDVGDEVEFKGEYEWNDKGGVIHWTHLDPRAVHESGWIRHNGVTYQ
jgi:hypothetical protein